MLGIGHNELVGGSVPKRFALAVATIKLPNAASIGWPCDLVAWLKAFKAFGRGHAA